MKHFVKFSSRYILGITLFWVIFSLHLQARSFTVEVTGSGSPIVLIPGLSCSAAVWQETTTWMSERYECHALTLAGFADVPAQVATQANFLATVATDLKTYLARFKTPPILIGHSLGGFLSMKIAIEAPALVEKIVVVDSYPSMGALFMGSGFSPEVARLMGEQQAKAMLAIPDEQYASGQRTGLENMIQDPKWVEIALQWSLSSDRATVFKAYAELLENDLREQMEDLHCPTLILQAGNGPNLDAKEWKELNKKQYGKHSNLDIQRNDEARHFIMYDAPVWFKNQLLNFL